MKIAVLLALATAAVADIINNEVASRDALHLLSGLNSDKRLTMA